jgi:hypothetical protein
MGHDDPIALVADEAPMLTPDAAGVLARIVRAHLAGHEPNSRRTET